LKTLNISTQNFNNLEQDHKNSFNESKVKLKLNDKNLPLTMDLSQWGNLQIIEGDYPYDFRSNETKLLISNGFNGSSNLNYKISIKGIELQNDCFIIHSVSVTNNTFKSVILKFIDLKYDTSDPGSFVRIIDNNEKVDKNNFFIIVYLIIY
jgi:hypothetical protein